jgi:hypothetical protein
MDEKQMPKAHTDVQLPKQGTWHTPLTTCTPLSKYLAMAVFIALPFVGFWVGVEYGQSHQVSSSKETLTNRAESEDVFGVSTFEDVESPLDKDAGELNPRMNLAESWLYTNERLGFTIRVPNMVGQSFVVEDAENRTVTFLTNDNEDINSPRVAFVVVAAPLSEFHAGSFLEMTHDHYWVRDIAHPSSPTSARYAGESGAYAFYLMKGNDCYPGNNCDVHAITGSILDTFTVTDVSHGTVSKPSSQAKVWREYFDSRSSLAFWYPTEWGEVKVEDVSLRLEDIQNDPTGQFDGIDLSRVQTEGYSFSFTNTQCNATDFCIIGYHVRYFSNENPIQLDCHEQQCTTLNLVDDRKMVEENYTFENKGNKWLCTEGYSTPGGNVYKKCRAYNGNIKVELQMGYRVKDSETLRQIHNNEKVVTLDDAIGKVDDDVDYSAFRSKYYELLKVTLLNP